MPAKNVLKQYLKNGYYHLYNRGVEKRKIFMDDQDYQVFLNYLKEYLEPINETKIKQKIIEAPYYLRDRLVKKLQMNNFTDEIELLAYCLMPNHFHLLIKQKIERGIESFMRSMATRYVGYFNKRHRRVGALFQNTYKAVLVNTDEQLVHLSRYIHQNPTHKGYSFMQYLYSSLGSYLGQWRTDWLKKEFIISRFSTVIKGLSYRDFLQNTVNNDNDKAMKHLWLE